jgi:hypothetical protein
MDDFYVKSNRGIKLEDVFLSLQNCYQTFSIFQERAKIRKINTLRLLLLHQKQPRT